MRTDTLIVGVVCLIAGFLAGVLYVDKPAPPSGGGAPPAATAPAANLQQQIGELERVTASQPQNREAWVALGNAYFDTDQPMKSVEAYNRALALDPKDADVLVDQGVMYRKLGWFDKAVANFKRALEVVPNHRNALYNLGVTYLNDLKDVPAAAKAWRQLLEASPDMPGADQLRQRVETMEQHPPIPPDGGKP